MPREHRVGLSGDFEVLIGSDPGCRVCVSDVPGIAPTHAALRRVGDRLFLKDCGSAAGTYLNGKRLPGERWVEVTRHDDITISDHSVELSPRLFLGRDRIGLDTSPLRYALPRSGRVLIDGVYLRATPGTVTAVMGPSGCGKTTLLNLINGYLVPTEGHVIIGEMHDLHTQHGSLRDFLGYVPQEDVLLPELTVRRSLHYRLRLRFPDMVHAVRDKLIEETCTRLGFEGSRLDRFLHTTVGSPGTVRGGLSGGERKRANIAHELVTKPLILVLDEPTSGLSSVDAEQIAQLLKELAIQDGLTVIMTIHQPSRDAYGKFDDLLLLTHEGQPAYYGKADEAVPFFESASGSPCGARNPAEYVVEILSKPGIRETPEAGQHGHGMGSVQPPPLPAAGGEPHRRVRRGRGGGSSVRNLVQQWFVLVQRGFRILGTERRNLALLFGQVPIIATLLLAAFWGYWNDERPFDEFARRVHFFHARKAAEEQQQMARHIEKYWRSAADDAAGNSEMISEAHGQRRGAVYFLLVAAAIWFGMMGACKEVVTEQHIVRRESRSCVHLFPYLCAKFSVIFLTVAVQTAALAFITAPFLLGLSAGGVTALWLALWAASAGAAGLGLMISCAARTVRASLTAVPLVLVPQLIFGGLLRPYVPPDGSPLSNALGVLTIQRWGFQAALSADSYSEDGVLRKEIGSLGVNRRGGTPGMIDSIDFADTSLARLFFGEGGRGRSDLPLLFLAGQTAGFLCVGYVILRRRFA